MARDKQRWMLLRRGVGARALAAGPHGRSTFAMTVYSSPQEDAFAKLVTCDDRSRIMKRCKQRLGMLSQRIAGAARGR